MLKKIDSPDTVLAVEVVGKLEKEDYQSVLVPGLRALLDGPGEIRCVFVFGDKYTGLTVGGTVEDSKLYLSELVHRDLSKWKPMRRRDEPRLAAPRHLRVPLHDAGRGRVLRARHRCRRPSTGPRRDAGRAVAPTPPPRPAPLPASRTGYGTGARRRPRYVLRKRNAAATSGSRMAPTQR